MAEVTETIYGSVVAGKEEGGGESENEKLQQKLDARLKELDIEVADLRERGAQRKDESE